MTIERGVNMDCDNKHYITEVRPLVYGETEDGEPLVIPEEILIGIQCKITGKWCSECKDNIQQHRK